MINHAKTFEIVASIADTHHPTCIRGTTEHVAAVAKPAAESLGIDYVEFNVANMSYDELQQTLQHARQSPMWAFFHGLHQAERLISSKLLENLFMVPHGKSFLCIIIDPEHRADSSMFRTLLAKMHHIDVDEHGVVPPPQPRYVTAEPQGVS